MAAPIVAPALQSNTTTISATDNATLRDILGVDFDAEFRTQLQLYGPGGSLTHGLGPEAGPERAGIWQRAYMQPGLGGAAPTVANEGQWFNDQIANYAPQLAAAAINQMSINMGTGALSPVQMSQITAAVASNPAMAKDLGQNLAGLLSSTAGLSLGSIFNIVRNYGPIGGALPADIATGLGMQLPGTAASTVQTAITGRQSSAIKAYMQIYGKAPDQATINRLAGMDDASLANWQDEQPYHGTTYGTYNAVQREFINAGWQTWFGHDPSDADIKWGVGKSAEDITARIDDSNYTPIPGMKIGGYKAYSKAGDDLSTRLFGYSTPDHLISLMRDAGIKP